jgi:hypothetical protein
MSANRVIVDLRRHHGGVPQIVRLVMQYVAGLGGATVEWLLRVDQNLQIPSGNRLGLGEASENKWGESICQHMLDLRKAQATEERFWVLSFDNALLSKVRAVTDQGLTVTAVYLGSLISGRGRTVIARNERFNLSTDPLPELTVDEACVMVKTLLLGGKHTSLENAFSQKELRPRLVQLDRRAAKRAGNLVSEYLISSVVAKGQSEGWLASERTQPGRSGTEVIYLTPHQLNGVSVTPAPILIPSQLVPTTADSEAPRQLRANEFEGFLAAQRIGSIPRTRDLLFDAMENIVTKPGYEPLLLIDLLDVSLAGAKERAEELSYTQEKNWDIAGRCVLRLMCRAGVLVTKLDKVIEDRIGRDSHRVASLAPEFRLDCEAYLANEIIKITPRFHYDDDTYYLGITIYRQGSSGKLSPSELKEKADALLTHLEQSGMIEMDSDHLIRPIKRSQALQTLVRE